MSLESKIEELTKAVLSLTAKIDAIQLAQPQQQTAATIPTLQEQAVIVEAIETATQQQQLHDFVDPELSPMPEVTKDDLVKMLTEFSKKSPSFREYVKPILKEYGAMKIADIDPKYYSSLQIRFHDLAVLHGVV